MNKNRSTRTYLCPQIGIINALGCGVDEIAHGLFSGDTAGLQLETGWLPSDPTALARVGRAQKRASSNPSDNTITPYPSDNAITPHVTTDLSTFSLEKNTATYSPSKSIPALQTNPAPRAHDYQAHYVTALCAVPPHLAYFNCRNNQLLLTALAQIEATVAAALTRYGPARIGVVLGTSTSGIENGEIAIAQHYAQGKTASSILLPPYHYAQQEIGMPALFLAQVLGITGPAYTISTACTSSAKAFASARNLLRYDFCDAVIVGGVDSLCQLTINGFTALSSLSEQLTNPMSRNRCGINIGEGAALFVMQREETAIELLGIGQTSDAYHISAPHPDGIGAQNAMRAALEDAQLPTHAISYLNLHATATTQNDAMEAHAVVHVFPDGIPTSGTKPMTGHTLGAAGATELAFCQLALQHQQLPPHIWDQQTDPTLPTLALVQQTSYAPQSAPHKTHICMSNSFAFGGSNISLIIGQRKP
ncbi:MAG: beta-ketoacyl-[acyl-carrier-protein] synthase family protein [Ottowia sp.]|jgi:3-oxoacyl-[acyl-carrier-protein] synthase-1|nr:beta-ketoacyl-[acyl-carrier-protein] synthase family protein [Ottowia sp.]